MLHRFSQFVVACSVILILVALVAIQVTLGALTVLSRRDPWINSFHVVCGAMVLTTSLVLTLRTWRSRFPERSATISKAGCEWSASDA